MSDIMSELFPGEPVTPRNMCEQCRFPCKSVITVTMIDPFTGEPFPPVNGEVNVEIIPA